MYGSQSGGLLVGSLEFRTWEIKSGWYNKGKDEFSVFYVTI